MLPTPCGRGYNRGKTKQHPHRRSRGFTLRLVCSNPRALPGEAEEKPAPECLATVSPLNLTDRKKKTLHSYSQPINVLVDQGSPG